MTQLSHELQVRTDSLAQRIRGSHVSEAFNVTGKIGLGKTTLLHALGERLLDENLVPVFLSPPLGAEDTAPAIIIQLADHLKAHGLLNGEAAQLQDPSLDLDQKLAVVTKCLEAVRDRVVLLCDEPREWLRSRVEPSDDHYTQNRKTRVVDTLISMDCRRVFAGPLPERANPSRITGYQLPFDSVRFSDQNFGGLESVAKALNAQLSDKLAVATALERRLWAAFAKASSVTDALLDASEWPTCWDLAKRLAETISLQPKLAPLRDLWSRLALFRGVMDADLVQELGAGQLEPDARAILDDGLLQPCNGGVELHDVLRQIPAQMGWQSWPLRRSTHERFADYFGRRAETSDTRPAAAMGDLLEGFHHAASAGNATALHQFKPFFVEQLHTLGRVLSKECGNHEAAIAVFEEAIRLDDRDDYAHHYLAYNIDWLASDEDRADLEYKKALELNKEHPWWWSRRINFLMTTGRLNEARKNWHDATTSLGLSPAEDSEQPFRALHLWVARLALHRGQLDFAEQVLASVPDSIRRRDTQFQALIRLYETLLEAERGRGVFPWSVPPERWWHTLPTLHFPPHVNGEPLTQWNPARVEEVDGEKVWLIIGAKTEGQPSTYGHLAIPRTSFDDASLDVKSDELEPDRFLELAFYGPQGILRIRAHPADIAMDDQLPGFDPPDPRRYLKKSS